MKFSLKTLAAVALSVSVAGCANGDSDAVQVTPASIKNFNWELVKIDNKAVVVDEHQSTPRLDVGDQLEASGVAGCNNFFGIAALKDGKFRIKPMGMTMKMCQDSAMDMELLVVSVLSEWSDATQKNDIMVLKNDAHSLTYIVSDLDG